MRKIEGVARPEKTIHAPEFHLGTLGRRPHKTETPSVIGLLVEAVIILFLSPSDQRNLELRVDLVAKCKLP